MVVKYDYRGDPFDTVGYGQGAAFDCATHPYECDFVQPGEYWTGSIAIDFGAAPNLRGNSLSLFSMSGMGKSYSVGSVSAAGPNTNFNWVPWLTLTGIFADWAPGSIYTSDLSFSFDQGRNITCWSGYSFWGGDGDPGSTCGNDYLEFISILSSGPGTWTKTVVSPSPVPLPASMPLLLSGLAAFGLIARRKKIKAI